MCDWKDWMPFGTCVIFKPVSSVVLIIKVHVFIAVDSGKLVNKENS